jgi:hypothetical protein
VTANDAAPTTSAQLGTFGYVASPGTTAFTIISGNKSAFCMKETSESGKTFYITESLGVSQTACT